MEKDVLRELGLADRNEALRFLKRLWAEQPTPCPRCGMALERLHRKAKKDSCDWQCRSCGTVYKTVRILDRLNEG